MHKVTRECDENVCSCGLRWGTDELDPHVPVSEPSREQNITSHIARLREAIRLTDVSE